MPRAHSVRVVLPPVLLGMALGGCRGESEQTRYREFMESHDVHTARLAHWAPGSPSLVVRAQDDPDRLEEMLRELRNARLTATPITPETGFFHISPTIVFYSLTADFVEGALWVAPARQCTFTDDGSWVCRQHPRQVEVHTETKTWRVVAPGLAKWMREAPVSR